MFEAMIAFSVRRRGVVLLLSLALMVLGLRAAATLPVDAVPDLTNVQVQVLTNAPALGALDVERFITLPVERALAGVPGMVELRSLSRQGTSAVTAVFADGTALTEARRYVGERLPQVRAEIDPRHGVPELGPMTTGLGEIYQFEVRGDRADPMTLRTVLDWEIAPRLRMVPGVIEVNTFGGALKTYEIALDPRRMAQLDISVAEVTEAVIASHRIAGGGTIVRGPEGILVRGDGLVETLEDLRNIVVARRPRGSLTVGQVAEVRFAPMLRRGAASRDGRGETVIGMAMMLVGENSRTVSRAIDAELRALNPTLPPGIRIEPFYDRTRLVDRTLRTVAKNLAEGGALVVVVLFLMLRNLRIGLVAAAMVPLCMLGAIIAMRALGVSGNLMSLGAIDFGLLVDGAIILLENAVHHAASKCEALGRPLTDLERRETVREAALEVRGATAFGELIIALVYAPILALEGVEGRMFHPMALTVLFALATAFVLSLTLVPALATYAMPLHLRETPSPIITVFTKAYEPLLHRTLAHPGRTAALALLLLGGSAGVAARLGSEFAPQLDEGSMLVETQRAPGVSLDEAVRQSQIIEQTLRRFPEVETVVSKTGCPEIANDPMGVEQSDVYVALGDREGWQTARDREGLVRAFQSALEAQLPGVAFGFSQPIQMRTNELLSGVRADVAVQITGDDLGTLAALGARVSQVVSRVRGASSVRADRVEGVPALRIVPDREALRLRGAQSEAVLSVVDLFGGHTVGEVFEERRRFPLRIRLDEAARRDLGTLGSLPVRLEPGVTAPLESLARIALTDEPSVVNHLGGQRRLIVQSNVLGRDLGGFVAEAQRAVARSVRLPPGYALRWGGQYDNLERARARLGVVIPSTLVMILVLLYASFGALRPAGIIFLNVPFAVTGGVLALAARGLPLSVSAGVGFIALSGVAVLNGLVLVTQIRSHLLRGDDAHTAAREGALRRVRPVLTTAMVAALGFLPMAFSAGDGAEVQRPLATVVVGGLLSSTFLTLVVLPTLCAHFLKVTAAKSTTAV